MLAGIDRLFADFGLDLAGRLQLAERSRDAYARQFQYESLRDRLADRFRGDRTSLARMLDGAVPVPALDQRSAAIAPVVRMFVNRVSRSAGPEYELVLYDYLVQLYRSRMAREGTGK